MNLPESEAQARAAFKHLPLPLKKSTLPSRYIHVTWNKDKARWTPLLGVKGRMFTLGYFKDEESAARIADQARWFLQDFLPRAPKYNFPEEIPPCDIIPRKVREIRCLLIASGVARNAPHSPGDFEKSLADSDVTPIASISSAPPEIQCCEKGVDGNPCADCLAAMRPLVDDLFPDPKEIVRGMRVQLCADMGIPLATSENEIEVENHIGGPR